MIHVVTEQMADELERYHLVYTCERCAHFDAPAGRCSFGYPTEDHRERPVVVGETLVFCKQFELA